VRHYNQDSGQRTDRVSSSPCWLLLLLLLLLLIIFLILILILLFLLCSPAGQRREFDRVCQFDPSATCFQPAQAVACRVLPRSYGTGGRRAAKSPPAVAGLEQVIPTAYFSIRDFAGSSCIERPLACSLAYQIVAGGQVCRHPAMQQQSYILEKLLIFHTEHATATTQTLADLQAAAEQLPKSAYAREAQPLTEILRKLEHGCKRGPLPNADIIPIVLARLGVRLLQSKASGEADSR